MVLPPRHDGQTTKTRRLFCPTSQARGAKIFVFPKDGIYDLTKPSRPHEGRNASSRFVVRAAMDAWRRKTCGASRTVKPCGPVPSTLGSSCAKRFAQRRWLKSPTHRGERGVSRKAIAQGVPDVSAYLYRLVGTFPFQPTGPAGAASARHSLRPLSRGSDGLMHHPDANCAAGTRTAILKIESDDAANLITSPRFAGRGRHRAK